MMALKSRLGMVNVGRPEGTTPITWPPPIMSSLSVFRALLPTRKIQVRPSSAAPPGTSPLT